MLTPRRLLAIAVAVAFGLSASPAAASAPTDADVQRALDRVVGAGAPGAAAYIKRGSREYKLASGVADLNTGRTLRPDDQYRIGSLTKTFVAAAALQLVGEGRLHLDDPVERWLPGTLPYGSQVTVQQLLNHTSGIPEYLTKTLPVLYAGDRLRAWTPAELVGLVRDEPLVHEPGATWAYSSTNYVLTGMIIESVTGRTLEEELTDRILKPLKLRDTTFPVASPFLPPLASRGYSLARDEAGNPVEGQLHDFTVQNPSWAWASGNIVSTLSDVARFERALFGGRLLQPRQLTAMKTTVTTAPDSGYGLGLFTFPTSCGRVWGHDGAIPGFANYVFSSEDGRSQYALMVNVYFPAAAVQQAFYVDASETAIRAAFGKRACAESPAAEQPQASKAVDPASAAQR